MTASPTSCSHLPVEHDLHRSSRAGDKASKCLSWVMSADPGRVRTSPHVGSTPESGRSSRGRDRSRWATSGNRCERARCPTAPKSRKPKRLCQQANGANLQPYPAERGVSSCLHSFAS
jgi:hypothetical protein